MVAVGHHFASSGFAVVVKKRKEGLAAAAGCSDQLLTVAEPEWTAFAVWCSALAVLALPEEEGVLVHCQ